MSAVPHRFRVVEDDLSGREIVALLGAHLASTHERSPSGSVHALDPFEDIDEPFSRFLTLVLRDGAAAPARCARPPRPRC